MEEAVRITVAEFYGRRNRYENAAAMRTRARAPAYASREPLCGG